MQPTVNTFSGMQGLESLRDFQESLDGTQSKESLADEMLKRSREFARVTCVALYLTGETSGELAPFRTSPTTAKRFFKRQFELLSAAGAVHRAIESAQTAVIPVSLAVDGDPKVRTLLLAPLLAGGQLMGLFLMGLDADASHVDRGNLPLIAVACKQFALMLRGHSLYDALRHDQIELQVAHDELSARVGELEGTREQLQASLHELRIKSAELEHLKAELELKVEDRTKELIQANQELARLSTIDALTGCYNRRYLEDAMSRESDRATRYGHQTGILIFDLNGMKQINDRYGHAMGDLALKETARLLRRTARKTDIVSRFGGDEFVVITPHTADTVRFVDRFQNAVNRWNRDHASDAFELSVSAGDSVTDPGVDLFEALRKADDRMYANKRAFYQTRPDLARVS